MSDSTQKTSLEEWLAGLAMLAVMGFGAWQAAQSLATPAVQSIKWSMSDFRQGLSTDAFSKSLDKNLPWREQLIATANSGRYVLTRGAGDKVRLGRDGWLFSVEELQFYDDAASHQAARLRILGEAAHSLQAQDVRLVVAVVPDKARLYAARLADGHYPSWNEGRYDSILTALREQQIAVVDLRPALAPDSEAAAFYYRTDTHWNQAGAQRAAALLATQLKSLSLDLPQTSFATSEQAALAERPGDLLRMMGLSEVPNFLRPTPDQEVAQQTQAEQSTGAGLFDEISVPVTLVGTSYSLRANFHGYLQQALSAQVLNVAKDGAGFIQSAKTYFADEAFKSAKPKLIIWEVPERMFSAPLSEAEKQGLKF